MDQILTFGQMALTAGMFRFAPEIAGLANRMLTRLGADHPLTGSQNRWSRVGHIHDPQAIIIRTNAGAIAAIVAASGAGRRPCLIGGAGPLLAMIRGVFDPTYGQPTTESELLEFQGQAAVVAQAGTPEGEDLAGFVGLIETSREDQLYTTLSNLPEERWAAVAALWL